MMSWHAPRASVARRQVTIVQRDLHEVRKTGAVAYHPGRSGDRSWRSTCWVEPPYVGLSISLLPTSNAFDHHIHLDVVARTTAPRTGHDLFWNCAGWASAAAVCRLRTGSVAPRTPKVIAAELQWWRRSLANIRLSAPAPRQQPLNSGGGNAYHSIGDAGSLGSVADGLKGRSNHLHGIARGLCRGSHAIRA